MSSNSDPSGMFGQCPPVTRNGDQLAAQLEEWGLDLRLGERDGSSGVEIRIAGGHAVEWLDACRFLDLFWLDASQLTRRLAAWSVS